MTVLKEPRRKRPLASGKSGAAFVLDEDAEQTEVARWLDEEHPDVKYYHVPNGGWRHKATARRLKAMGAKPRVPDLVFPMARKAYHGLYVEMKRTEGGKLSPRQKDWLEWLTEAGYLAVVRKGADEAKAAITDYFDF